MRSAGHIRGGTYRGHPHPAPAGPVIAFSNLKKGLRRAWFGS